MILYLHLLGEIMTEIETKYINVCRLRRQRTVTRDMYGFTKYYSKEKEYIFAYKLNDEEFQDVLTGKIYRMWDAKCRLPKLILFKNLIRKLMGRNKKFVTRAYKYAFDKETVTDTELKELLTDKNFEQKIILISNCTNSNYDLDIYDKEEHINK